MPKVGQVAISLVNAIEHGHVPVDDPESAAAPFALLNDKQAPNGHRETLTGMIAQIDDAVGKIDKEMSDIVENSSDFESMRDIIKSLSGEIENVIQLHSQVDAGNTLHSMEESALTDVYNQYESFTAQNAQLDATISVLDQLRTWSNLIGRVESALQSGELEAAREKLAVADSAYQHVQTQTQLIAVLPEMKLKVDTLTVSVKDSFMSLWDEMVSINQHEKTTTLTLTPDSDALSTLIFSLDTYGLLASRVSNLASNLQEQFIQPILQGTFDLSTDHNLCITEISDCRSPDQIFESLAHFVTHLSTILPNSILPLLIPAILPNLHSNLLNTFLPTYIPNSITELDMFERLLESVIHFDKHLTSLEWAAETPLKAWVNQAPRMWFLNRQATFLHETRELVSRPSKPVIISSGVDTLESAMAPRPEERAGVDHVEEEEIADEEDSWGFHTEGLEMEDDVEGDSWKWEDDTADEALSAPGDPDSFPYTISGIPDALMEIVERVLQEGVELSSAKYSVFSVATCGREYPSIVSSVLGVWRAASQLQRIQMTSGERMKLSNEALYLSHQLVPHTNETVISAEIERLDRCGNAWFGWELARVKTSLSTTLSSTNKFIHLTDPEQARKCTGVINSITHDLMALSKEYQGIIPNHKRRNALGEILSSVLGYLNASLGGMDDISADESTFLITLYRSLFTLETLFAPFEARIFCAEWLKSQFIRELLEWRMVDIMESWREGSLQGVFSREEMVGWLRKLFQDSDSRTKNITEIQRG